MSFTNYLHKLVFPLIILLLAYLPLAGQTPYVFRHLKVENGLSNNNVKTILKDCEGFLWIGTANGLNRYDGYSFKVYQPKEKDIHSLLSNDIWNLQEDGLGNLWIGSEARYCIYDRDKDNFITDIPSYLLKIGIQINGTYKVHVDKRHNLWVLQGQNAFYFNFSHKTLKTFKIENFPEETPELSISDDGENLYLLWNSTLLKLENNAKKCKRVDNISLPSNSIIEKHIYTDYHGGIQRIQRTLIGETVKNTIGRQCRESSYRSIQFYCPLLSSVRINSIYIINSGISYTLIDCTIRSHQRTSAISYLTDSKHPLEFTAHYVNSK